MKDSILISTLFLCIFSAFAANIVTPYSGVRVTMKKDVLRDNYTDLIREAANDVVKNTRWKDLNYTYGGDVWGFLFKMEEIKCIKSTYQPKGPYTMTISSGFLRLAEPGNPLSFTFSFKWYFRILGVYLLYGTNTATITVSDLTLIQGFSGTKPDSTFSLKWAEPTYTESVFFGLINNWMSYLIKGLLYTPVQEALTFEVYDDFVAHLGQWSNIKVKFYEDQKLLNMTLTNVFYSVTEEVVGYVSFGFKTNVTVPGRIYNKMMWKDFSNPVIVNAKDDFQICVASDILANIVETQSKAKDFILVLSGEKIQVTRARDLINIMSRLYEQFGPDEPVFIGCRPIADRGIVMINDKKVKDTEMRFQGAGYCIFYSEAQERDILGAAFQIRGTVDKVFSADTSEFRLYGKVKDIELAQGWVYSAAVPVDNLPAFSELEYKIINLMNGFIAAPNGLAIPVPKGFTGRDPEYLGFEQICRSYSK